MKPTHTTRIIATLVFTIAASLASCALWSSAPKTPQQFSEMSDEDFAKFTTSLTAYADAASTIALKEGEDARKDLERFCALVDGDTVIAHASDWLGPWMPLIMLEVQRMIDVHGTLPTARMYDMFQALRLGVRTALDRKEVGP